MNRKCGESWKFRQLEPKGYRKGLTPKPGKPNYESACVKSNYLTIIRRIIPETKSRGLFDNIPQVIIRAAASETAFYFILFITSIRTSRNRAVAILKIIASV